MGIAVISNFDLCRRYSEGRVLYIFFLSLLLFQSPGYSQSFNTENYVIKNFGLEEGLPQSSVNDIIQTKDGYIWLATYGGLVRFDGNTFTTFDRSNTKGLSYDRILKIYEGTENDIWVFPENSSNIFFRFRDGSADQFKFDDEVQGAIELYTDNNETLWLTGFSSIYRFTDNEFVKASIKDDSESIKKALGDTNGVWLVDNKKLFKTTGNTAVVVKELNRNGIIGYIRVTEFPQGSGRLFVGTNGDGILKIEKGEESFFNTSNGLPINQFLSFKQEEKNLFANLYGKIAFWNGVKFENLSLLDDIRDYTLNTIIEDFEGNLWISTSGNGLFKLRSSIISMIDGEQGLENEIMLSLTELQDGTALLSSNCGGIFEWKNGKATLSTIQEYFFSGCNWSVFQDSQENIWVGANELYVTKSLDEPGIVLGSKDGYTGSFTFAITESKNKNILVGAARGFYVYDGENFDHYTTAEGLYNNNVISIFEDDKGVIWLGTKNGLNKFEDGTVSKVELMSHSSDSEVIEQPSIRAIHSDEQGALWFGSYGNGLFRLKDGEITNFTSSSGLFDNIISHIVEDERGNFWMGSNRGISRVSKDELNKFADGEIEQISTTSYGSVDGMNSAETNGGFQPSTFKDSLGNIYFPTVEGVAVVSTRDVENTRFPPPVIIENLKTNEGSISLSDSISLSYDTPYLEINYTAINFTDPKKVKFRYRLKGLDEAWIDVDNRRTAMYSKIPPGEYIFQVTASNDAVNWNTENASFHLAIAPPFWQTNWFYAMAVLSFLFSGGLIVNQRLARLKKENEQQKQFTEKLIQSQENERKRIASELHDGLGQQILVIKNRADLAKQKMGNVEEMNLQLDEIMQSAVSSISDVRNISYALRPVHLEKFGLTEALINLCDQLEHASAIDWSYHIDDIDQIIPKEKEINFYRIIQEGVNNILKHSNAEEASVMIKREQTSLVAKIWDDGKGFEISIADKSNGLGFLGMKERVQTFGGTLLIDSKPEKGTSLTIMIPIIDNE